MESNEQAEKVPNDLEGHSEYECEDEMTGLPVEGDIGSKEWHKRIDEAFFKNL